MCFFKQLLIFSIIACISSASFANEVGDLTKNPNVEQPDDVAVLFYRAVHPHIKKGSHNYTKSKSHPILNDLLERTVRQILKKDPRGKFFFRYYIYQCALDNEECDQQGDFDPHYEVKFDIHYDFDK